MSATPSELIELPVAEPRAAAGGAAARRQAPRERVRVVNHSVTERPGLFRELANVARDVVRHRDLLRELALRDIRIRYKQAVMGFGWALFMPMLIVAAGMIVRYAMARIGGGPLEVASIGGMAIKALPWAFFVGAVQMASASLIANQQLITKVYFPREVIPLATILAQSFDSLIGAVLLAVLLPFLGLTFSVQLLWIPVLAVLLFGFTLACAVFLGCANLFFRDVKYIVQVLLTFGIFFTPVFFEPAMFGPLGARILMLNPVAPVLEGLRLAAFEGHNLLRPLTLVSDGSTILAWTPWYLVYLAVLAVGGLAASIRIFRRATMRFAEVA